MAQQNKNRLAPPLPATKKKPAKSARPFFAKSRTFYLADRITRWISLLLVFAATVLLVTPSLFHKSEKYPPRFTAVDDIHASISFSVIDEEEMDRLIRIKQDLSPYFYTHERQPLEIAQKKADALFAFAREQQKTALGASTETLAAAIIENALAKAAIPLDKTLAGLLIQYASQADLLIALQTTLQHLYEERGIIDSLSRYRSYEREERIRISTPPRKRPKNNLVTRNLLESAQVRDYLETDYFVAQRYYSIFLPEVMTLLTHLATELSQQPNVMFDAEMTRDHLAEEIAAIKKRPPLKRYQKGVILFQKDQPVDRTLLDRMNAAYAHTLYRRLIGASCYIALLFMVVFYYIRQFRPDMMFSTRNVFLVGSPVLLALLAGWIGYDVLMQTAQYRESAGYLLPAGLVGMLAVVLLDIRLGILLVTVTALAFSITTGMDFKPFLMALIGGYAGVAALTTVKERKDVLWAGLFVGSVNALVILLANFIDDPTVLKGNAMFWGFGNGIVCGILTLPALAAFEYVFGVVTDIRLLELTGLNHNLLQQLEEKAPGTYQHSLGVVKLSEAAAKAIGANFLLVRAGALFHDIGKILKPKYFGENQVSLDEKSLHIKLSPYMSAMVIKNHVKAGIELAKQHRLPPRIVDFIPEHQGTTLIAWPYHEALKRFENSESTDPVRMEDFRYPGPKPQSIETAIVMLADSVEATATSRFTSLSVNEDELRYCVQKTIAEKFNDEQFDECDLTLRDLHQIRESFVKTLLSRFHSRIAYPTQSIQGPSPNPQPIRRERSEA